MKKLFILLSAAFLLSACSATKKVELGELSSEPCTNKLSTTQAPRFTGMTADNLVIDHVGNLIFVSVDARGYCNSNYKFLLNEDYNDITLRLVNTNVNKDECVCTKRIRTALKNMMPGTYDLKITNAKGDVLFVEGQITVQAKYD